MPNKKTGYLMPAIMFLLAGVAGYSLYQFTQKTQQTAPTLTTESGKTTRPDTNATSGNPLIGTRRPDTVLPDLDGNQRDINEWDGNVVLVNFWATWCPPCRREMPGFIELREQYHAQGFEILGIAIDTPDLVRDFIDSLGVNYPILHGEMDAVAISSAYGNTMGGLPYSVLIDRLGNIRFLHTGELPKLRLETQIQALL